MAAPYSYSVSLRISHPSIDPDALTKSLRLKPSNTWKAGEPRRTPTGRPLKGLNHGSFWTARLIQKRFATTPSRSLEAALAAEVRRLEKHAALLRRIQRGGGRTELFVGIFGQNGFNYGGELDTKLLAGLSKLGFITRPRHLSMTMRSNSALVTDTCVAALRASYSAAQRGR